MWFCYFKNNLKDIAEKRTFRNGFYEQYSIEENQAVKSVVQKYKIKYKQELKQLKSKPHWNAEQIKMYS